MKRRKRNERIYLPLERGINKMTKILKIDRALYEVDDQEKNYKYYGRNAKWQELDLAESEKNKKSIDGYIRIFPNGKQKVFH